jgi:hypothetical protein
METLWNVVSVVIFLILTVTGWRAFRSGESQKCIVIGLALLALPLLDQALKKENSSRTIVPHRIP